MLNWSKWPPLLRVPLAYGIVAGFLGFVLLMVLYYTGHHPFLIPIFFDFRIIVLSIFILFALKELRESHYGGLLHFWQGMIGSFLLTLIFAMVTSSLLYAFALWNHAFVTEYVELTLAQIKMFPKQEMERLGKEVYEEGIRSLQLADAEFLATRYFTQSFILSFFLSVIISVILRRQPKIT
ncbi:MAG: DUF4199 domain-containing protein [Cyclobacteriaceae bacterium]